MNFLENITFRRHRAQSLNETNISSDKSINGSTLDVTASSLPNVSSNENDELLEELKNEIDKLKLELAAAHGEIINLSLENTQLKNSLQESSSKNELLKKATNELRSNLCSPINQSKLSTPIAKTKKQKKEHRKDNSTLKEITCTPKRKLASLNQTLTNEAKTNNITSDETIEKNKNITHKKCQKICILSSNKDNNILTIAEQNFENRKVIHYLTPNVGIKKMTENLDNKLKDYTLNDYCVILIGEEDFLTTNNYFDIIIHLRHTLQSMIHTNIILCVPTYKCREYSMMFNWRVETFNNLLFFDILSHEYAYVIDSNLQLSYDYDMFSRRNGKLNNVGMHNVFDNIKEFILNLEIQNNIVNTDNYDQLTDNKSDFFRV